MTSRHDAMALSLPPIFLLSTHLSPDELHRLEDSIPSLTYDVSEAAVVLGKISKRERALFELRRVKLETEPVAADDHVPQAKRRKLHVSASDGPPTAHNDVENTVKVLRLAWLTDSLDQGQVLPMDDYLLYEGRKAVPKPKTAPTSTSSIIKRAAKDQVKSLVTSRHSAHTSNNNASQPPALLHRTTSEHDVPLPEVPAFLNTTYSCQRPTPVDPPNGAFVEELKKIRTLRLLRGDQIGVRAYSTSIATLAAYPRTLQGPLDVARLPGCGAKIAVLYQQWVETGRAKEVGDAADDQRMLVLKQFYDIWGVGDTTAREFYRKGWRDLDDLVEFGWDPLSRVQQIGIKYYDEFQVTISRPEVESIASVILEHARRLDGGFQMAIVGGYRRGKQQSGDVDVVLSHQDEALTLNLIGKVVMSLEKAKFITHTLSLATRSSERGQEPLAWKGEGVRGSGFDTLDKALVVWQDGGRPEAPHRRVDIIVSPWKTVGCAVMGWSGGTTFQRDLRRYCKKEKGLKFDSSGIRRRTDGAWVDLESGTGTGTGGGTGPSPAPDMETAERRVFEGLGLPWRRPEERCTG